MDINQFEQEAHLVLDWMKHYLENVESYPVKSPVKPGEILNQLPQNPPISSQSMMAIMRDLEEIIMPGITHWHSPNFFAYFPANKCRASILAEMVTATLGAQCMSWATSPAATELEQRMMEWLTNMIGLPDDFTGVIQDTASTATLCAILSARERASDFKINREGLSNQPKYTVYCSEQVHTSIDKAVMIAGIGTNQLRKIAVDDKFALLPEELEKSIREDLEAGFHPLCVVSAYGTTGSTAVDPINAINTLASQYNLWHHVDAAYAGTALICQEFRDLGKGIERADSLVFNPHKWMFTNFDCSAYFVRDKDALINTFSITPEYLKTNEDDLVNNYRDWGIQLGRRFRALKLWFVIRDFGLEGLQERIRSHISYAKWLEEKIRSENDFFLLAPVNFNLVCFHYKPENSCDPEKVNLLNEQLLEKVNSAGNIYLSHTKLNGVFTLRMAIANTDVDLQHVENAWEEILNTAQLLHA